jgi:eukaryotic-like serine/threonine-protein kinase
MAATAYDVDRPTVDPAAVKATDPLIGRRIDHFEIRALLGEGGMGTVYLAHDLSLERPVAIKVLRRDLATNHLIVGRLVLEARAQARLQHPNVVTIYHIGAYEGAPYFAMEYVRGKTLGDHLEHGGPVPWAEAIEHIIQTTRALLGAHNRGIVHRDIKPSNLILAAPAGSGASPVEIKVADFGLATPVGSPEEPFAGSPYYASPEQLVGRPPDHRSDIYALGVTFHELLTGAPPFKAESMREMLALHLHAPRPEIPADRAPWRLRQLITEMMDPDPHKRPWTYEELLARLESLRPKPWVAGGVVARGMALAVDVTLMLAFAQALLVVVGLSSSALAHHLAGVAFAIYYVAAHRQWGKTLGKRLLGLRIQGTTRPVNVGRLVLRFLVEFWAPITLAVMIDLEISSAPSLVAMGEALASARGAGDVVSVALRVVLLPNLPLAIPWVGGFLFGLFDDNRQTLHDRAARTRVIYDIRTR